MILQFKNTLLTTTLQHTEDLLGCHCNLSSKYLRGTGRLEPAWSCNSVYPCIKECWCCVSLDKWSKHQRNKNPVGKNAKNKKAVEKNGVSHFFFKKKTDSPLPLFFSWLLDFSTACPIYAANIAPITGYLEYEKYAHEGINKIFKQSTKNEIFLANF